MKNRMFFIAAAGLLAATAATVSPLASAQVSIGVGIGAPYYAPPPVVYAPPPRAYYAPPPVIYGPPVYAYGPGYWGPHHYYRGYYGHRGYYGPYRHWR